MFNNIHISSNAEAAIGRRRQLIAVLCITAGALVVVTLWYIIFTTDKAIPALNAIVRDAIPYSGVTNPVTAVLLNFRSYDTLLEIVVLALVAMAQRTPCITFTPTALYSEHAAKLLKQWLAPLIIVLSGYLLWTGAHQPGGAFQAGALLAAVSIIGLMLRTSTQPLPMRGLTVLLVAGVIAFIAAGVLTFWFTGTVLQYPPLYAQLAIILIELAAMLSIATALALYYLNLA